MKDREVIDAFVAHLGTGGHPGLHVERRPDVENRDSEDIDAIAGPFAIEHTSIDTVPNQRRDSDWFIRATGGLMEELGTVPPFRLSITLEYNAVRKGQNWAAIRGALKKFVGDEAPGLPEGQSVVESRADIPFRVHVVKSSGRRPGVFFSRFEPDDDTLSARLKCTVDRKARKLAKYHSAEFTTVLLVENNDIALMNECKMREAIRRAFPGGLPPSVDQVWYADTCLPSEIEFQELTPKLGESAG